MTNMRPPNKSIILKVVILGDGGVGKSCLMNSFVWNTFEENNFHTIGVEFMNKDIEIDGEKYTLQIWDTAGQERFRALRTPFYRGSDLCMLCYAIDDYDSFRGLKQWRNEFLQYADVNCDTFPFIVVGTKNDLSSQCRQIDMKEVQQWCDEFHIASCIETSAKTATNVHEAFIMAVRQWKQMERMAESELKQQDTINLTRTIRLAQQNRFCCIGGGVQQHQQPNNTTATTTTTNLSGFDSDDEYSARTPTPKRYNSSGSSSWRSNNSSITNNYDQL